MQCCYFEQISVARCCCEAKKSLTCKQQSRSTALDGRWFYRRDTCFTYHSAYSIKLVAFLSLNKIPTLRKKKIRPWTNLNFCPFSDTAGWCFILNVLPCSHVFLEWPCQHILIVLSPLKKTKITEGNAVYALCTTSEVTYASTLNSRWRPHIDSSTILWLAAPWHVTLRWFSVDCHWQVLSCWWLKRCQMAFQVPPARHFQHYCFATSHTIHTNASKFSFSFSSQHQSTAQVTLRRLQSDQDRSCHSPNAH